LTHPRETLVRRYDSTDAILVLAPLMWSLHIVGSKYALSNGFLPLPFLIIRFVSAAIVFVAIAFFVDHTLRIEGLRDQLYVAGAAVMFAANQIAFVYALKATTAVTVSLVFGLFPITVGVLAAAIGHEAMTAQKAVAGIVSFVGVSLVVIGIPGGMSKLSGEIWGILIALCIPLSWAFFSLLIGPPMKRNTPMRINAVVLPGTALAVLLVGFSTLGNQDYESPTPLAWICLAYSALGTLVVTNLLWFRVVGRVGAATSSYFLNLQPFGAALLAWLLLGETITLIQILGGIGIGAGIVISRVRPRAPTPL
jgi:drug/metabolite transporter (DMT)-like permease